MRGVFSHIQTVKGIDMNSEDVLILIGWCMFLAGIVGLIIMGIV